jgi:NitT/TauT family transport system permease protein
VRRDTGTVRSDTLLRFAPLGVLVVLAFMWEASVRVGVLNPFIVPPLSAIAEDMVSLPEDPIFWRSLTITSQEMALGFGIGVAIGLVIGVLSAASSWFRTSVMPYVVMLQSMPRVALAPLFLIWFGFGIESKVAIAAAVCFFPVAINTAVGLASADRDQEALVRSLGASPAQRLTLLTIPSAAPYIFAGVKTAVALALSGAIVAEFVSSPAGLGFMISSATFLVDIPRVFSVLFILAILGGGVFRVVDQMDRRLVYWRPSART